MTFHSSKALSDSVTFKLALTDSLTSLSTFFLRVYFLFGFSTGADSVLGSIFLVLYFLLA